MTEKPEAWDARFAERLPDIRIDTTTGGRDDHTGKAVVSIQQYGFALLSGIGKRLDRDKDAKELADFMASLGSIVPQSPRGEEVEDVRDFSDIEEKDDRGYRSRGELTPHSDPPTLIALHCLKPAKAGGESFLVSVRSIHDRMKAVDPRLLEELFGEFPQMRVAGQYGNPEPGPEPNGRPILARRGDTISCTYYRPFIEKGADALGKPLSQAQIAAMDLFDECANAPDLALRFTLQPNDTLVLHNRSVLHARTDFEDWPHLDDRRHLLRIWVDTPDLFPVAPEHELGNLFGEIVATTN